MVDGIEIIINEGIRDKYKALICPKENIIFLNDKKYSITNEKIEELLDNLVLFKYEYGSSNNIDDTEFTIIVYSNDKKTKYHGKGIFPTNFNKIIEILDEVIYGK